MTSREAHARNIDESATGVPESASAPPTITPPAITPLMIISAPIDGTASGNQIRNICDKVTGERLAGNSTEVVDLLNAQSTMATAPYNTLDLIGHAESPQYYLKIGDWQIGLQDTDNDLDVNDNNMTDFIRNHLAPILAELDINRLRLLGCSTATTEAGFATMKTLAAELNTPGKGEFVVYGTRRPITSGDFGPDGFSADDDTLHPSNATGPAPPFSFTEQSFIGTRSEIALTPKMLRAEAYESHESDAKAWPRSDVTFEVSQKIWSLIDPKFAWSLPGLLTLPQYEILLPEKSTSSRAKASAASASKPRANNRFHRVQILLDYQIVRVFPSSMHSPRTVLPRVLPLRAPLRVPPPRVDHREGLVYRVKDPVALASLVSSLTSSPDRRDR